VLEINVHDRIRVIVSLLKKQYGAPRESSDRDPIEVLVQTILSQNTSDRNSGSAFKSLMTRFGSWEELSQADVGAIAETIRSGGLGEIKAQRIKQALHEIGRRQGKMELDFLSKLTIPEAEKWLLQLNGVGLKTARCVLLFALGMPALPVDTHILRVSRRLSLIAPRASPEEAHRVLGEIVPAEDVYQFHVLIIEHGRRVCRARQPDCGHCTVREVCPRNGV
jgi:endonuclease III